MRTWADDVDRTPKIVIESLVSHQTLAKQGNRSPDQANSRAVASYPGDMKVEKIGRKSESTFGTGHRMTENSSSRSCSVLNK